MHYNYLTHIKNKFLNLQLESKKLQPCEDVPLFQPITYENILVAFLILPIGILMAMMTLMIEKRIKNYIFSTDYVQN